MTSSTLLLILTASVVLFAFEDPQCTRWQKNLSTLCLSKTSGYFRKFHEHSFDNPAVMSHFNTTSEEIIKCFHDLPCPTSRDIKMGNRIGAYRDTMFALTDSFVKCAKTLESHNSDCYYSWDPFMAVDVDGRILENFDNRDVCKAYFGPMDCMRHEIVEYCTMDAWKSFKKKAKEFGERIYGCDFRGIFTLPTLHSFYSRPRYYSVFVMQPLTPARKNSSSIKRPDLQGLYICGSCGQNFVHAASLNRHRRTRHNSEHQCLLCHNQMKPDETLHQHMKELHNLTTVFNCSCCNFGFAKKSDLLEHTKAMNETGTVGDAKPVSTTNNPPGWLLQNVLQGKPYEVRTKKRSMSATTSSSSSSSSSATREPTPEVYQVPEECSQQLNDAVDLVLKSGVFTVHDVFLKGSIPRWPTLHSSTNRSRFSYINFI
ncbi:hypothetical protein L5515_006059 [Caenorhabditis briggsae]|uniref:C2H2-type domain-containing protein n=1 Tax=Caenorhabditis briggsae TaxID=6238 RepID=A0AAE9JKF0_CAEBR|nr:hypothetical protein L5515_006059 [Caenorhabditis briggsae]